MLILPRVQILIDHYVSLLTSKGKHLRGKKTIVLQHWSMKQAEYRHGLSDIFKISERSCFMLILERIIDIFIP